jgi:glutathione synthase/RimK-type ligase-like ATP-grasp enzyme
VHRRSVAFATYEGAPALTADDRLSVPLLEGLGIDVEPAIWSDSGIEWQRFDAVILRSTWDYHRRPVEFRDWLHRLESDGVPMWNPATLARWNMDKRYLRDLAERGIPTVPTAWISMGDGVDLRGLMESRGWSDAVLKPVIAATSYRTVRVSRADVGRRMSEPGEAMLQPFVPRVADEGEWSLVFLGGEYSHAVLKRPAAGDFRVQEEFGGSSQTADAPRTLRASAARVLAAVDHPWLYARVDGVRDDDGGLLLMELEMLEPLLFLAHHPDAPTRFADAIRHATAR